MKKLIILFFILLFINGMKAQNYVPFPDSNASWEVAYYSELNCMPPSYYCYTLQYFLSGDTVIFSKNYKKLYYIGLGQPFAQKIYYGGLRQDTVERKLLLLPAYNPSEVIVQDLKNLQIGDTLPYSWSASTIIWITDIDIVVIGGIPRKKYLLDCANNICNNSYIIEGIGSNCGLIDPIGYFEGGSFLVCFKQNDSIVFSPYGYCNIVDDPGIDELVTHKIILHVYPNPSSEILNINIDCENKISQLGLTIIIYNSEGRIIKKIKNVSKEKMEIRINNYEKGVYYIEGIKGSEKVFMQKFIKI